MPTTPELGVDLDDVRASLAVDSLSHFTRASWPLVEPGQPLVWGWHLDVICEHLEAVSRGWIRYLVMNVPPRYMKSLLTSVFWPAWEWVQKPETQYLTVSHSASISGRDARKTRMLMQTTGYGLPDEDLREINHGQDPTVLMRIGYQGLLAFAGNEWDFAGDQNLKWRYENDRRGIRIATSIGGGGTGEGGHRITVDDPHKLEEWDSEDKRKAAIEFCCEIAPSRRNSRAAALVLIMQRVHEEDATAAVLGKIEDVEGWGEEVVHLCLPEEYEPSHPFVTPADVELVSAEISQEDAQAGRGEAGWSPVIPGDRRTEPGDLLFPERFDEDEAKAHRGMGPLRYASNYRQMPAPVEGNVFLKAKWRYYGQGGDKEMLPPFWERVLCSWDLTFGSKSATASYVCGQLWGKDGPDVYLLAEIFARMTFPEMKDAVRALHGFAPLDQAGGKGAIDVEEAADGKALVQEISKEIPGIRGVPVPQLSKVARAVAVQPYQDSGNAYLPRGVIPAPPGYEERPTREFVNTLAMFPAAASKDEVDTLSQAWQRLYHDPIDEVASVPAGPTGPAVVERHGIRKEGDRYVDKE